MRARTITEHVQWLGAVDWNRRLFDSLIPLPDGTTYNAYLVTGTERTALLDTVDPTFTDDLLEQLSSVPRIDYLVAHHAEQDHAGAIPAVLALHPETTVLCTAKGKDMLASHLGIAPERFRVVADGERIDLGGRTLRFIHAPWVHWPETMLTWLEEDRILFTCDMFGSHLASSDLYATDPCRVAEAAKRYFAEIMQPFRKTIRQHLEKLAALDIAIIAPSHGPVHRDPAAIMDLYRRWSAGTPSNLVVIPYVSMHGSTGRMVARLVDGLAARGVAAQPFDLAVVDIGQVAMALLDAGTVVVGTPTVLGGPHPLAAYAAFLANALRPGVRFLSVIGSYGWGGKAVEVLAGMVKNLEVEVLTPVLAKGAPSPADLAAVDALAETIDRRHRESGFPPHLQM